MKPDLLLLHGALGSQEHFSLLTPLLLNHFNIHLLDFEGHGGRATDKAYSIDLFTENVKAYIESKQLQEVLVFGYSMGGYVALNLAHQHPHLVSKIATLGTKFDWNPASTQKEVQMLDPEKIAVKVPHFAKALAQLHHAQDWKMVLQKTAAMMLNLADQPNLTVESLSQINQPITIGLGDQDRMVSQQESEWAATHLANGELQVLVGVVHPIERLEKQTLANYIMQTLTVH